jgi:hypothetical protein
MTDELDELGAIDWLLFEFKEPDLHGQLLPHVIDLVDRRLIRILDVLFIVKDDQGDCVLFTTETLQESGIRDLGILAGASSGILSEEDAIAAADALDPGVFGVLLLFENLWSVPFTVAARKAGAQLVAQGHIPTQALIAALDELEA